LNFLKFFLPDALFILFFEFSGSCCTLRSLDLPAEAQPRRTFDLDHGDGAELLGQFEAPACELQGRSSGSPVANPRAPNEVPLSFFLFCFKISSLAGSLSRVPQSRGTHGRRRMRRGPAPDAVLQVAAPRRSNRCRFFGSGPIRGFPGMPSTSSRGLRLRLVQARAPAHRLLPR